jgi:tripartite-type tricarboxylate transporter receptor subunit TctC
MCRLLRKSGSISVLRGVLAPKGLPEDVLKILVDTTQKVVNSPKWNEFMDNTYRISHWIGPKDYEQYLKEELELYRVLLTEVGLADSKK